MLSWRFVKKRKALVEFRASAATSSGKCQFVIVCNMNAETDESQLRSSTFLILCLCVCHDRSDMDVGYDGTRVAGMGMVDGGWGMGVGMGTGDSELGTLPLTTSGLIARKASSFQASAILTSVLIP